VEEEILIQELSNHLKYVCHSSFSTDWIANQLLKICMGWWREEGSIFLSQC